jgi:hypothetical protein
VIKMASEYIPLNKINNSSFNESSLI